MQLKIYLKNREKPVVFKNIDRDVVCDFGDWLERNPIHNHKSFVFDFPNDKHFMVYRTHVQAYEIKQK